MRSVERQACARVLEWLPCVQPESPLIFLYLLTHSNAFPPPLPPSSLHSVFVKCCKSVDGGNVVSDVLISRGLRHAQRCNKQATRVHHLVSTTVRETGNGRQQVVRKLPHVHHTPTGLMSDLSPGLSFTIWSPKRTLITQMSRERKAGRCLICLSMTCSFSGALT